jgi:hypothetical protein
MTSDVKGWEQLFLRLPHGFSLGLVYRKSRANKPTVDHADIRGLATTLLASVSACLILGTGVPCGLVTLPRLPHRGCASSERGWKPRKCVRQPAAIVMISVAR